MIKLRAEIKGGRKPEFQIRDDGVIVRGSRMCVPEIDELKREIMKKEITDFVSRCLTCQRVKEEHQKPAGKIQPLPILVWKWDKITMDFVTGLPRTQRQHKAIWVIVDRLMKSAHFLPVSNDDPLDKLA